MKSIYWYDFETTGTDPARDRAIQFAGVRTDYELNVIDKPLNLYCRPTNEVLPSPAAMLVTQILVSDLLKTGMRELPFITRIHEEFARPETCVSGYNSIRFDDEFTRHTLYRNFFDPYAREWQQGNSRWDVIDVFRMAYALRPDGMEWPVNDQGVPSFRLEDLTKANEIGHDSAHDAVSDVLATVELTKKLKSVQSSLYEYLFALRQKKKVLQQLYPLGKFPLVHVSSMYPAASGCIAIVLPLCTHPVNGNGVICYDLSVDPSALITCDAEELRRLVFSPGGELAEDETRIPLKTIHINRAPAVAPIATLREQDANRLGLDRSHCEENMRKIQQAAGIVEKVQESFSSTRFETADDPDLMLYQGEFFSNRDKALMEEVRMMSGEALTQFVPDFEDPRLQEMLFRFRARNYPETLTVQESARWDEYRRALWDDGAVVETRLAEIESLRREGNDSPCLEDLRSYLLSLKAEVL